MYGGLFPPSNRRILTSRFTHSRLFFSSPGCRLSVICPSKLSSGRQVQRARTNPFLFSLDYSILPPFSHSSPFFLRDLAALSATFAGPDTSPTRPSPLSTPPPYDCDLDFFLPRLLGQISCKEEAGEQQKEKRKISIQSIRHSVGSATDSESSRNPCGDIPKCAA